LKSDDFFEAMVQHRRNNWQCVRENNLSLSEHICESRYVILASEINFGNINAKEDAQADGPKGLDIPVPFKAASHDCKSARFTSKFRRVARAVSDQQPREDLAAMRYYLYIVFSKEIKQPLQNGQHIHFSCIVFSLPC
jgi:hypothetical protein